MAYGRKRFNDSMWTLIKNSWSQINAFPRALWNDLSKLKEIFKVLYENRESMNDLFESLSDSQVDWAFQVRALDGDLFVMLFGGGLTLHYLSPPKRVTRQHPSRVLHRSPHCHEHKHSKSRQPKTDYFINRNLSCYKLLSNNTERYQ